MIEIPCVGTPGPAAHGNGRRRGYIFKLSVPQISVKRIPARVLAIESADILWLELMKFLLLRNPQAGRGPHLGNVDVLFAVIVEVEPGGAHSGADIVHVRCGCNRSECPVAVIAIEIVAPKVVRHVQAGAAVRVIVAPGAGEAVAIILDVQSGS